MTHTFFKLIKADVNHFLKALGERDCFRATGDCSIHQFSARH